MQQWAVPAAAARASGVPLDVLYLADPSNAYYLQVACSLCPVPCTLDVLYLADPSNAYYLQVTCR